MIVLFKHKNLEFEFWNQIDSRLTAAILGLAYYSFRKFGIKIVITCLNRTKEENKKVNGSKYSAHLFCRAADVRTFYYSEKQLKEVIKYLEDTWGDFLYIKHHDSGSGDHLHINIRYQYRRV